VVGVDGSEGSRVALRWAVEQSTDRAAHVEAVIAWRPAPTLTSSAGRPPASVRTPDEQRSEAAAVLDSVVRSVPDGTHDGIDCHVISGAADRVLLDAAAEADLLVIGGHSGGRLSGKLPWSTGQQVVRDARCPVVVVPVLER
jgi:nucleotide-binding universal stress UspA family protein